jgi:hypothetical protein
MNKKTDKILGLAIILLLFNIAVQAQARFGLTYNTAQPLNETQNYVENYSWRGIGLESRWDVLDNEWQVAFSGSWNVFYNSKSGTFTDGTRTTTGNQYRYINSYPVLVSMHKMFSFENNKGTRWYLGAGAGPYYIEQRTDLGLLTTVSGNWHFGVAPEVGFIIPVGMKNDLLFEIRYNHAFSSNGSPDYSYLGLNIGLLL